MNKYSGKALVRARVSAPFRGFRPKVEYLEDRTQPGSVLPFGEFSLMGRDLFERDPLTGRMEEQRAAEQRLLAELERADSVSAFALLGPSTVTVREASATLDLGGAGVSAAQPTDDRALQAAVQAAAPQALGGKLANVVSELQTGNALGMRQAPVTSMRAIAPRPLDVRSAPNNQSGNDGPSIAAITLYTSYWGYTGADSGNAVATDAYDNGYVAGYTSVFGTKDVRVSLVAPDGTTLYGEYYGYDLDAGGDEEALGIAVNPDTGETWITGYAFNGTDTDLFVAQVDLYSGTLVGAVFVDSGLGNDRGNSIRFTGGFLFVTGNMANGVGSDVYVAALAAADLSTVYSNAFQIDGSVNNQGDAIDVAPTGAAYVVGTMNDGANHLFVARVNVEGALEQSLVRTDTSIGGGVAVNIEGANTMVYLTGNVFVPTPAARFNGIVQKLQDTGKGFTAVYTGFIANAIAEGPIDITGTDIRVTAAGKAYLMTEWHWPLCCGLPYRDLDAHIYKLNTAGTAFEDQYHWGITGAEALGIDTGKGLALNGTIVTATGFAGTTPAPGSFPVTDGVFQFDHADNAHDIPDGFISRINLNTGG